MPSAVGSAQAPESPATTKRNGYATGVASIRSTMRAFRPVMLAMLVASCGQPDRVAGRDAAETFRRVGGIAADDEQPATRVDDEAPVAGLDVRVGGGPASATRARGRVDLDRPAAVEACLGEVRLADVEEDVAEAVEVEHLALDLSALD